MKKAVVFVLALLLTAAFTAIGPVRTTGAAEKAKEKVAAFKLFDFEKDEEVKGLFKENDGDKNYVVEKSTEHATSGKYSLKVAFPKEGSWPGPHFLKFNGDWSKYNALLIDVFNPTDKIVTVHFAGADKDAGFSETAYFGEFNKRFHQDIAIKPGKSTLTIDLEGVTTENRERQVNLKAIKRFALFVTDRPEDLVLYFDNIRLENVTEEEE